MLDLMMLRSDAFWFDAPVPVESVPDYLDVISQPSDYQTVGSHLVNGIYGDNPIAFAAEMRLIFTNAVKYNWKPDHACHQVRHR